MGHRTADVGKFTMDGPAYSIWTHRSAVTSQKERIRWVPQDAAEHGTTPQRVLWKTEPKSNQASGSDYMLIGNAGGTGYVRQEHGDNQQLAGPRTNTGSSTDKWAGFWVFFVFVLFCVTNSIREKTVRGGHCNRFKRRGRRIKPKLRAESGSWIEYLAVKDI